MLYSRIDIAISNDIETTCKKATIYFERLYESNPDKLIQVGFGFLFFFLFFGVEFH